LFHASLTFFRTREYIEKEYIGQTSDLQFVYSIQIKNSTRKD